MKKSRNNQDFEFPNPNPYEVLLNEARYILLYDVINSESAKEVNTKLLGMALEHCKAPIYLEINSVGGSVADGIAIMNTIQHIPCPVITIINGEACSMAGIISVMGSIRMMTPHSYWLGHPMYDEVGGNPQTIQDRGIYLSKLEEDLQSVFKTKTKLTSEEFQKMMRGELWLSTNECLAKGIVDEIVETGKRVIKIIKKKGK
jgi:ATP-dependent Clp protease protease subunit